MPEILPSPEIWHRDDFALLCFWRKLYRCAEVGVDRGEFALMFLNRFPQCEEYWGVDEYRPYPEMAYDRQADRDIALQRLAPHGRRFKLIRESSTDAAGYFAHGSLDFVYLDGAHDYESVKADIKAWWPKLSDRGILAGHDWTDQPHHAGVKRAVTEFAGQAERTVYLTLVDGYRAEECPSWYVYRDAMPGADWRRC